MPRPLKMTDIAKAAGVSPMTVSRAFKRDASVSKSTREKILRVADELGYVFDSTASNLRSKKTGFVAVTIPSLDNDNFAHTVRALSDELEQHDLQILLGYTNYDIDNEEKLVEQLLRRRPEAIVVTGGKHTPRTRRMLENARIPVVEMWDLPENQIDHVIGFSNAAATHKLVDHLVEQGFTRIAFIGGESEGDTRGSDRRRGFIEAMKRHGLDHSRLVSAGPAPISMREGSEAMAHMLDTYADTEAAICVSDLSAFGALSECQRRGIRVPQDIAIAGFGAFEISAYSVPTITTVDAFSTEIGTETGKLLLRVLRDNGVGDEKSVRRIDPKLVVRQSTYHP